MLERPASQFWGLNGHCSAEGIKHEQWLKTPNVKILLQ
jgi:hypothetical protein